MNIVSFGGGTNSTAMIIGMYLHKIPIDLITFADTGGEQPHTYEYIAIFNEWLKKHGFPEKQREDWFVRVRDVPEGINFEDTDANEKMIERDNLSIIFSGHTLKPLQTRRGLVFIQSRYLSHVSDVLDVLELYERFTPQGTPYIVAKAGFLLQAVIMPYDVITAGFVERLQRLARDCAFTLDLRRQEEERAAAHEAAGDPAQCTFNVDTSTGEVLEDEGEAGEDG